MQALLRFFELVRRELEASDVRGEIGGRSPEGPRVVWGSMANGMRVVALFDEDVPDLTEKQARLRALMDSFASLPTLEDPVGSIAPRASSAHELDEALVGLAHRARAAAALVIDDSSPVIWGNSLVPHGPEDVEEAIWVARVATEVRQAGHELAQLVEKELNEVRALLRDSSEGSQLSRDIERLREIGVRALDRVHILAMRALAATRAHEGKALPVDAPSDLWVVVRHFANIYRLVLVFDGPFSELHAESALIHGVPQIERLVTSLPPRDPVSGGAKVAVLRRLRRV